MKNGRTSSIAWIGLPVMVVANFVLRHWLEHAGLYLYDFLPRWYPRGASIIFSGQYPLWKFLFPLRELDGSWTTTTLVLTHVVSGWLGGPQRAWYVYNALLIVASFTTS